MILVELIRLVIVLSLTAAGYTFNREVVGWFGISRVSPEEARLIASVLGAGVGYVAGGAAGRALLRAIGAVERRVDRVSGGELVAGGLGLLVGGIAGALIAWPVLALIPEALLSYPVAALLFITAAYLALRVAVRKRFDLYSMMGLYPDIRFLGRADQSQGPKVLDTSAIIDGRIVDVARSGFLTGHIVCPVFVLNELRTIADSADGARRSRGRRGLEVLETLQGDPSIQLEVTDDMISDVHDVDAKLVELARRLQGALVTTDYNLHKSAELRGIAVMNVNTLAAALKPMVQAGEVIKVQIIREGTQPGQGVGYLEDGTMVVVEGAERSVGGEIPATVTSVIQTAAGRMIFATLRDRAAGSGGA